jgi:hypothetical protein
MATSRLSVVSRARYTSPMPPAPSVATISYGPRRVPMLMSRSVEYTAGLAAETGANAEQRRRCRTEIDNGMTSEAPAQTVEASTRQGPSRMHGEVRQQPVMRLYRTERESLSDAHAPTSLA